LPRIEVLGIFPTWEGLAAQVVTLAAIVIGFWLSGRKTAA
jgi:high-affinity iron transporter